MSLDTFPMPLDALAGNGRGLDEFRLANETEIRALLRQLVDGQVPLYLSTPEGANCSASLWSIDSARGYLVFDIETGSPTVQRVLQSEEVTVVGYLDAVKLQFELQHMVVVRGPRGDSALNARLPRELFRFQRRGAYRVRTLERHSPVASFLHPGWPEMALGLRVLDVSIGGCALFLPDDVPPFPAGSRVAGVRVELDSDTLFTAGLVLHHVTAIHPESHGVRLGCEFTGLSSESERTLQRFIDQTQKRRRLLSLD